MAKEHSRHIDDRNRLIIAIAMPFSGMKHTAQSSKVFRAGSLGYFYLYGSEETSLEKLPDPFQPLNEFGVEVLSCATGLAHDDHLGRDIAIASLLKHPGAKGIITPSQLEWLLYGAAALQTKLLIDASMAGQGDIPVDRASRLASNYSERVYGSMSIEPDQATTNEVQEFWRKAEDWTRLPRPSSPIQELALMSIFLQDLTKKANQIQSRFEDRLGVSRTREHGATIFAEDESGNSLWDRDAHAYWVHNARGVAYRRLTPWPGHESEVDHARHRVNSVAKYLGKLHELPTCLLSPSTELQADSWFVRFSEFCRSIPTTE